MYRCNQFGACSRSYPIANGVHPLASSRLVAEMLGAIQDIVLGLDDLGEELHVDDPLVANFAGPKRFAEEINHR